MKPWTNTDAPTGHEYYEIEFLIFDCRKVMKLHFADEKRTCWRKPMIVVCWKQRTVMYKCC